ncbi:MAG: FAD-dependent oxidoreductase [Proteobacteria bacterium]|nr:FAD-dependent oxidoreductase [Pseudomonadota bacterium]
MIRLDDPASLAGSYDVVVVGAGPAGLEAATLASDLGLKTLLVDDNAAPGEQIYRAATTTPVGERATLGEDYWQGLAIVEAFAASAASYASRATVWFVTPQETGNGNGRRFQVGVSLGGASRLIDAREVILATGAIERPFPISGWTLPGVMAAGGAQILLKTSGLLPTGSVVVAGTGPLLPLLMSQLLAAGASIDAFLDTNPIQNWIDAARHLPDFARSPNLVKGLGMLWKTRRRVPVVSGVTGLRAEGQGRVRSVVYRKGGKEQRMPCDVLLLHQGVIPNVNLANSIGCIHDWDGAQLAWVPRLNDWLETTVSGVTIAGDGGGVAGAASAASSGRLAALGVAWRLRTIDAEECDRRSASVRATLARAKRGRGFIDAFFRSRRSFRVPPDDETLICRCEEVTAGKLRETVSLGVTGPNQMKAFLRCGMGPCQGRFCGVTVTELIADCRGVGPQEVGYFRLRPPVKPVTVGEIAALPVTEAAIKAVIR